MAAIPESHRDLFDKQTFAHVASVMPDGTPHVTPVWIDHDEATGHVLVNTERGRQKEVNWRRNPRAGVSMVDPEDPYRYLSVQGESKEAVDQRCQQLRTELEKQQLTVRSVDYDQADGLVSASPVAHDAIGEWLPSATTPMLGDALGALFPFSASTLLEESGVRSFGEHDAGETGNGTAIDNIGH